MINKTHLRGFASMSKEDRKKIASSGGKAAHANGTAHRFTSAEASAAGKKGGKMAQEKGTAHRFAGTKGGRPF